jgi:hypothetical protein
MVGRVTITRANPIGEHLRMYNNLKRNLGGFWHFPFSFCKYYCRFKACLQHLSVKTQKFQIKIVKIVIYFLSFRVKKANFSSTIGNALILLWKLNNMRQVFTRHISASDFFSINFLLKWLPKSSNSHTQTIVASGHKDKDLGSYRSFIIL